MPGVNLPTSASSNGTPDRWELRPDELTPQFDPADLGFLTTDDVEPLDKVIGQDRALRALDFGLAVRHRGYNVFVCGMRGAGSKDLLRSLLQEHARREPSPDDWVYLYNFDEPDRPLALRLPSEHGIRLRAALEEIIERLRRDLPAALKAKDFEAERDRLGTEYSKRSEDQFNEVVEHARRLNMGVRALPQGVVVFPLKDGRPMEPPEIKQLSESERAEILRHQAELEEAVGELAAKQQEMSRQLRQEVEEIVRTFARRILDPLIARVKSQHPSESLEAWLDRIRDHMLDNLERLRAETQENGELPPPLRGLAAISHNRSRFAFGDAGKTV
jgi:hypothetical protein